MTYRGRVQNGVVVFEGTPPLQEGILVRVEAEKEPAKQPVPGTAEAILRHAGIWQSEAEEVDRLLEELRQTKQAELKAQQEQKL